MWLICSQRCGGLLFRALFTEVDLDSSGAYQDHRVVQPGYLCLNCGSPALDLGELPAELAAEEEEDALPTRREILCPVCETMVEVFEDEECPNCGAPLTLA